MSDGKYELPGFGAWFRGGRGNGGFGAGSGAGAGASTPAALWADDEFILADDGAQDLTLTYLPLGTSTDVKLNGLGQRRGVDYTVDGSTVHLLTAADALTGWVLDVHYQYDADEPAYVVPSLDAPTVVQTAVAGAEGGGSLTLTPGSIPTSGQLLIAIVNVSQFAGATIANTPSGWTLLEDTLPSGVTYSRQMVFTKTAGGAETGSYPFTFTTAENHVAVLLVVSEGTVIDHTVLDSMASGGSLGDPQLLPSITDTAGDSLLITAALADNLSGAAATFGTGLSMAVEYNPPGGYYYIIAGTLDEATAAGVPINPEVTTGVDLDLAITMLVHGS